MRHRSRLKAYGYALLVLIASPAILLAQTHAKPQRTVGVVVNTREAELGYTLFSPLESHRTYLVDLKGRLINQWQSTTKPGQSVYLLENGDLLRASDLEETILLGGGAVERYSWDGHFLSRYVYSSDTYISHHDFEPMPNGNIILIARDLWSAEEVIQAGRDPALLDQGLLYSGHLVEIDPSGSIVWEWHVWDHLVQDYDETKENHGVVADHPELINLNYINNHEHNDFTHFNSVDYNADLDQILLSPRAFHEVWVIDHSTTTAQAASHAGGDYGQGGDLLYRWGNPAAYDVGTLEDQQLFEQHDARWIEEDLPGEGNILIFNNGVNRPEGIYSSVDEIVAPVDRAGFYDMDGATFGPEGPVWTYTAAPDPAGFYSKRTSGAHRLPNGNTLICAGDSGTIFEVTAAGNLVWKYVNPDAGEAAGIVEQGEAIPEDDYSTMNRLFRAYRYPQDYGAFDGRDLTPGAFIETYPEDWEGEEGESTDGETVDGESGDGEISDGETTDGETTDGETTDGETTDGETTDGETTDGETTDGETTDGETTDGETIDGETIDGEVTDGEAADGESIEGEAVEGEGEEHAEGEGEYGPGLEGEPSVDGEIVPSEGEDPGEAETSEGEESPEGNVEGDAEGDVEPPCTDREAPVALSRNVSLRLDTSGSAHLSAGAIDAGSYDDCRIVEWRISRQTFGCADLGPNTILLTVLDAERRQDTAEATVTVADPSGACAQGTEGEPPPGPGTDGEAEASEEDGEAEPPATIDGELTEEGETDPDAKKILFCGPAEEGPGSGRSNALLMAAAAALLGIRLRSHKPSSTARS